MNLISQLGAYSYYLIVTLIMAVIALMVLRMIVIYADLNPLCASGATRS